jgi:hypothetical protein
MACLYHIFPSYLKSTFFKERASTFVVFRGAPHAEQFQIRLLKGGIHISAVSCQISAIDKLPDFRKQILKLPNFRIIFPDFRTFNI